MGSGDSAGDTGGSDGTASGGGSGGGGDVGDGIPPGDGSDGGGSGDSSGGNGDGGDGGGDTGAPQQHGPCPEAMPDGWILCEDFEHVGDAPLEHFANFQSEMGRLAVEEGPSVSGSSSLRISHQMGTDWSGWLSFRFGNGPESQGMVYTPDESYDDVWVRLHVRTSDDWPGHGHDDFFELEALRPDIADMGFFVQARAVSPVMLDEMITRANSCISAEGDDICGPMTPAATLGEQVGQAPIFSADDAGQWHCVELHMQLNAVDGTDGLLESFVDGQSQGALDGLDLRADRDDVTINSVRMATYWSGGGPPQSLMRWVDDVVVSTGRPGCNEPG